MTSTSSAGVLLHRTGPDGLELLLVHPGGPYWKGKDAAAWSIPKGLIDDGEDPWLAARREFAEETGHALAGAGIALTPVRTPGRKVVHAWLVAGDLDASTIVSNTFELEWPPRSGRMQSFPEIDRAAWFDGPTALVKVHRGQRPIVEEAIARLASP